MKQHMVDLLPESLRARAQARMVASRNITAAVTALAVVVVVTTLSRLDRLGAEERLAGMRIQARQLEDHESQANELLDDLKVLTDLIDRHRAVETPLPVSRVLATVIGKLPPSVTLDRVDFEMGQRRPTRSVRRATTGGTKNETAEVEDRVLLIEIAGFAATDNDIAEFVTQLQHTSPFEHVSLDFSRQRLVNDRGAREFRLSLTIDLVNRYVMHEVVRAGSEREVTHGE